MDGRGRLEGKKVLITHGTGWLGPALCKEIASEGGAVIAPAENICDGGAEDMTALTGSAVVDVVIANLSVPAPQTRADAVTDDEWRHVFAHLVDPLPRLSRLVLPGMIERRQGKIIIIGSAAALRGMRNASTYSAARGAQVSYVRAVGTEVARHNVQVNLIAPNFVDDPLYFPAETQALDAFSQRLKREVPVGRMGKPAEIASFAAFLACDDANFFAGQILPFAGGWVT
jgi:2-keto-3-deoxy-L-fuconate dehydrogenase